MNRILAHHSIGIIIIPRFLCNMCMRTTDLALPPPAEGLAVGSSPVVTSPTSTYGAGVVGCSIAGTAPPEPAARRRCRCLPRAGNGLLRSPAVKASARAPRHPQQEQRGGTKTSYSKKNVLFQKNTTTDSVMGSH